MITTPLVLAVIAGIIYGIIRSVFAVEKEEEYARKKKQPHPYLESIIVSLVVYLACNYFM